jgi:hypothetical protein
MMGENGVLVHEEVLERDGYLFGVRVLEQREHWAPFRLARAGVRVGLKQRGEAAVTAASNATNAITDEPFCVSISVTMGYPDPRLNAGLAPDTASINQISYASCCKSAPGPSLHQRGGTAAVMVRAACSFVLQRYDHVRKFKLKDNSEVPCVVDGQLRMFPLPELSLCYSGKTWYERAFGAHLESDHDVYRQLVADTLMSPQFKAKLAFDALRTNPWAPAPEALRGAYDEAPTLRLFFASMRNSQAASFCALVGPWVGDLVRSWLYELHRSKDWIIEAENFAPQGEAEVSGTGSGEDDEQEPEYEWICMRAHNHGVMVLPAEEC